MPPLTDMQIIRGKKLKQIFSDHWEPFEKEHPGMCPAIPKNVDKMLKCGTEEMGFHLYKCSKCGEEKKIFHTCKSRFCSSCGVARTKRWTEQYEVLFADTSYRHIMFHPPSEFRDYFGVGKTPYYNMLYTTAHQTLKDWYEKKNYLPGIMAVMHTFGRNEKFTPHIHALMTCGELDKTQTKWLSVDFLPYVFFKQHFKENFLRNMQKLWKKDQIEKNHNRFALCLLHSSKATLSKKFWIKPSTSTSGQNSKTLTTLLNILPVIQNVLLLLKAELLAMTTVTLPSTSLSIKLKISLQNKDGSLNEFIDGQLTPLLSEKKRLESEKGTVGERVHKWLELSEKTFNFACYTRLRFAHGKLTGKERNTCNHRCELYSKRQNIKS